MDSEHPHDLPDLLDDPPAVWMRRYPRRVVASRAQFDEGEGILLLQRVGV